MSYVSLAAAFCVLFSVTLQFAQGAPLSEFRTGIATNYGGAQDGMDPYNPSFGTKEGSCGYFLLDKAKYPFWSVGALSTSNVFARAGPVSGCGQCYEVQCQQEGGQYAGRCNQDPNQRSVTIMITDSCPECAADHLDIQALTYNKMAPMALGRIDIKYRRVECTPPSDLKVSIDKNSGAGGWIRVTIEEVAGLGSVKTVQMKGPNTGWMGLNNVWGAAWELTTVPQAPVDIRIQSIDGQEVTAFSVITQNGKVGKLPVGVNFQLTGTGPGIPSGAPGGSPPQVVAFAGPAGNNPGNVQTLAVNNTFSPALAPTTSTSTSSPASSPSPSSPSSPSPSSSPSSPPSPPPPSPPSPNNSGSSPSPSSPPPSPPSPYNSGSLPSPSPPPPSPPSPYNSGSSYSPSPPPPSPPSPYNSGSSSGSQGPPPPPSPPPPSGSNNNGGSNSKGTCSDIPPSSAYSCAQQSAFGSCSQGWMKAGNQDHPEGWCAKTCGRC